MRKIAIYKVLIGDYDNLTNELLKTQEDSADFLYDYYFISDHKLELPKPWKLILVNRKFESSSVENRFYKMGIPAIFEDYDYSIYLDANISINGNLNELLTDIINDGHYLYAYPHYRNTTIEEEITNCFIYSRITYRDMLAAKKYLYDHLMIKVGFECGVLIRKKKCIHLDDLFRNWFSLYKDNVKRDQFYFSLALMNLGLRCHSLGENTIRCDNGVFKLHAHKNKLTLLQKAYIVIKVRLYKLIKSF